jgi:hypothetical protein
MSVVGMLSGGTGQADDGVAMDADEAAGLADAVAFGEVMEDGCGLLVGHAAVEQRGALALGETSLAGVAVEQADVVGLAVAIADGEIAGIALPVQGAVTILAAKARKIIHNQVASRLAGWVNVQGFGLELLDILRCLVILCSVIQGHHQKPATTSGGYLELSMNPKARSSTTVSGSTKRRDQRAISSGVLAWFIDQLTVIDYVI